MSIALATDTVMAVLGSADVWMVGQERIAPRVALLAFSVWMEQSL